MTRFKDITGQRFGRLTANTYLGNSMWSCTCDCGKQKIVNGINLRREDTRSCGCLQKETASKTHKGKTSPMKNKHFSEETKNKMSKSKKGKFVGKNNHRWNPNLTDNERITGRFYYEYYEWRPEVYKRDLYTCQKCGNSRGGNLNAHHIESYSNNKELRTSLENGITFCKRCHKNFHHQYGYGNNTRAQLIEFMGDKQ